MQKMERILIGEQTYPIKIDLNVLEALQEQYGTIHEFELDIIGLRIKDGELINVEPSIKAIKAVLPLMINEGLEIEAASTGKPYEPVNDQIFQDCCIHFEKLAQIIHTEFKRCFAKK